VKVGDSVLLASHGGSEVTLNELKYSVVQEEDILGILT
jgi:co-chaperonin GroES (HSP10)